MAGTLTRRGMLSAAGAALFVGGCAAPVVTRPAETTFILLRHADRSGEELSAKGRARAAALVGALDDIAIDAIYSPSLTRNVDTARPLATARNLEIRHIPMTGVGTQLMRAHPKGTVVWVGNKGNLRGLWAELALPGAPPLDYGDLFIARPGAAGFTVTRRRFGP